MGDHPRLQQKVHNKGFVMARRRSKNLINITPFVDVLLILFVVVIAVANFSGKKGFDFFPSLALQSQQIDELMTENAKLVTTQELNKDKIADQQKQQEKIKELEKALTDTKKELAAAEAKPEVKPVDQSELKKVKSELAKYKKEVGELQGFRQKYYDKVAYNARIKNGKYYIDGQQVDQNLFKQITATVVSFNINYDENDPAYVEMVEYWKQHGITMTSN